MAPDVLPYGSWPTPITAARVIEAAVRLGGLRSDGDDLWWLELRPQEGGRTGLVRRRADGTVDDLLPAPWNVRTAVHEYGGGAAWFRDGVAWFTNWADQRLYRLDPGSEPVAVTPEPAVPRGLRYADGDVSPDGTTIACVRERHEADGTVVNEIVLLPVGGRRRSRWPSPDPTSCRTRGGGPTAPGLCWVEWDHPNMPWDGTRLIAHVDGEDVLVAGGPRGVGAAAGLGAGRHAAVPVGPQRLVEPLPLVAVGRDRAGRRHRRRDRRAPVGVRPAPLRAVRRRLDRLRLLARRLRPPRHRRPERPRAATSTSRTASGRDLAVIGTTVHAIAASPAEEAAVVAVDLAPPPPSRVLRPPRALGLDPGFLPPAEAVDFPTTGGRTAHALVYAPANPGLRGPPRRAAAGHHVRARRPDGGGPAVAGRSTSGSGPAGASPWST